MDRLAEAIEFAAMDLSIQKTLTLTNFTEVYWLFQEMEKLVKREKSFDEIFDLLRHGQDAVWSPEDPLPFLALNYIQMPILLILATIKRKPWNKVNFCLGQVL